MAEENKSHDYEPKVGEEASVETTDRGLFDFLGKKKETEEPKPADYEHHDTKPSGYEHHDTKPSGYEHHDTKPSGYEHHDTKPSGYDHHDHDHETVTADFGHKVTVSEPEPAYVTHEPKYEDHKEEKKPSLVGKLRRSDSSSSSSSSDEEEGENGEKKKKKKGLKEKIKEKVGGEKEEDTSVPVEKCEEQQPEKKGFLDKIKEKLPGQKKTGCEETPVAVTPPPPPPPSTHEHTESCGSEGKEKKGILEKIKEKLPGYHPKTSDDEKEKEKEVKEY